MDFEQAAGLAQLEAMSAQALDELAFGVVRTCADGEVVDYNALESKMAGSADHMYLLVKR